MMPGKNSLNTTINYKFRMENLLGLWILPRQPIATYTLYKKYFKLNCWKFLNGSFDKFIPQTQIVNGNVVVRADGLALLNANEHEL